MAGVVEEEIEEDEEDLGAEEDLGEEEEEEVEGEDLAAVEEEGVEEEEEVEAEEVVVEEVASEGERVWLLNLTGMKVYSLPVVKKMH